MEQSTLLAAIAAGTIFLMGVILFSGGSTRKDARVQAVAGSKKKRNLLDKLKVDDAGGRRKQIEEKLLKIEEDKKAKKKKANSVPGKLLQAGWSMDPKTFNLISIGIAIGAFAFSFLLLGMGKVLIAAGIGIVSGFGLPRFILNGAVNRRQKKFTENFADAMEIIVRGVRTGLPLGDCLKIIGHESPDPLGHEFRLLVQAESVGIPIEVALEQMYERMTTPEVKFFSTVLNIQRTTGGNLGESLANLANVLRGRKLLREKIKALSAEAKMSAMIIGALPVVVGAIVFVIQPEYMDELINTPTGNRMLLVAVGLMVVGIFSMKKMINFKI